MDALSVSVNSAQTRIKVDRIATLVSGEDWTYQYSNNVYVEPYTLSAMLMPIPITSSWSTSGTRYFVADYSFSNSSSNWIDDPITPTSNYIKGIASSGSNNDIVTTVASQPNNGSMWLSWYGANAGTDDQIAIQCGWSSPASAPISFTFWGGGKVDVYRNDVYQDSYSINGTQQTTNPQQTADQFVSVCIIPFRAREILVISNRGGGFIHLFDDIDASQDNPTITPAAPFWWTVPTGAAKVACAPCLFQTSGYICGNTSYFVKPPQANTQPTTITYQSYNGGSVSASLTAATDPTTPFTPDGTTNTALVCVQLGGNGTTTPNVYGAHIYFDPITASTANTPTVLDGWLQKAKLEVPDNATELKWELTFSNPAELSSTVANFTSVSNRPYQFTIGNFTAYGVSDPPRQELMIYDTVSHVTVEVRDKWKLFEHYLFTDPTPLDGLSLTAAFTLILNSAGIQANEIDIEESGFNLPNSDTPSKTDFSVLINAGETAAEWLTRLHENYCATWFMGWCPQLDGSGWVFKIVSPATLGTTSQLTLYATIQDAFDNSSADETNFIQYVYRAYNDHSLEAESNAIWVTGRDPRTGLPIVAYKEDTASQDPTTPVAAQPTNWLGEVRKYGLYDATISSQNALTQCVNILYDRLTKRRIVAEFTSDFLFKQNGLPIWRGDVVTLDGLGDYRIKSISTEFIQEPDNTSNNWFWRPTKYVCEKVDPSISGLTSYFGLSLHSIAGAHKLKLRSKSIVRKDALSQGLINQKPLQVYLN